MTSPVRKAILDELETRIQSTEDLLEILDEIRTTVATAETQNDLHAGLYRIYQRKTVSDHVLKDWIKFLDSTLGPELIEREQEDQ